MAHRTTPEKKYLSLFWLSVDSGATEAEREAARLHMDKLCRLYPELEGVTVWVAQGDDPVDGGVYEQWSEGDDTPDDDSTVRVWAVNRANSGRAAEIAIMVAFVVLLMLAGFALIG